MNYLVYNGFWNPNGAPESARPLIDAARAAGDTLTVTPNHAWVAAFSANGVAVCGEYTLSAGDTVLFWDKDVRLAGAMEAVGARVYNSARAIALCDDKAATHDLLARAGVPMPLTLSAPMTYRDMTEQGSRQFRRTAKEMLGFPMVVKECYGSLGGQVYLARDAQELCQLTKSMENRGFLAQQYIAESSGNDKRLYVVGGQVVAAMRRRNESDFRANIEHGGTGSAYEPTEQERRLAVQCCRILGLHFGGVDILDSAAGPLVCEVNSNAHMAGIMAATGIDVAKIIWQYIKGKS